MQSPLLRNPNSQNFQCKFSDMIGNKKFIFNFVPEEQSLFISNVETHEDFKVNTEESDFVPGGFVYKSTMLENSDNWSSKIELMSYKDKPEIKLTLTQSPISKSIVTVTQKCQ
jgi:hypothetical protein